jgi:hypothetical protein
MTGRASKAKPRCLYDEPWVQRSSLCPSCDLLRSLAPLDRPGPSCSGTIPDRLGEHIMGDGPRPPGRVQLDCPVVGVRVGEGPRGSGRGRRSSRAGWSRRRRHRWPGRRLGAEHVDQDAGVGPFPFNLGSRGATAGPASTFGADQCLGVQQGERCCNDRLNSPSVSGTMGGRRQWVASWRPNSYRLRVPIPRTISCSARLINGTVGAGKTSVAEKVRDLLTDAACPMQSSTWTGYGDPGPARPAIGST